ncbi:MAG: hypothetical protein ACLPKB_35495 [Xanthobacteraceae bacterium]
MPVFELFGRYLRDEMLVAIEVTGRQFKGPVRNKALERLFPKLAAEETLLERVKAADAVNPAEISLHDGVDQFELCEEDNEPSWAPHYAIAARQLRIGEAEIDYPRYFVLRQRRLSDGAIMLHVDEQTARWRDEREQKAAMDLAGQLIDAQNRETSGFHFWTSPVKAISGDFAYFEQVLRDDERSTALWAVGDCSGHGLNAAMLRLITVSWLEDLVAQYVGRRRKKLLKVNRGEESNPFAESNPSREILNRLHSKMRRVLERMPQARMMGIRGLDGAIVYLCRSPKGHFQVYLAASKFDIHRVADFGGSNMITTYPVAGKIWRRSDFMLREKGLGGTNVEGAHKAEKRYMRRDDLLVCVSDGVENVINGRHGEIPKGVRRNDMKSFVRYVANKAKGSADEFMKIAKSVIDTKADGQLPDDVLVSVLDLKKILSVDK